MPFYQKLGQIPRKHHIWFHRNGAAPTFKDEGIAYEHVITTEGFNEAYSIMYHLRPPTRVRSVKLLKCEELKKAADSPLRHHHLRTANIARKRDFHGPTELNTIDKEEDTEILVKDGPRWTCVTMAHHPFDVVGWDGYVYPFTFNAQDFEPITGTVHQPPPIHQTFEIRGYVVCTFAPRLLDTHPEAVKIPWVHDNVEADEVLFYVRGNFGSRRGIEPASITLHPRGIPHGPHPGTIMASKNALRTEELAVMFDTQHTLELTEAAVALDDDKYPLSWLD